MTEVSTGAAPDSQNHALLETRNLSLFLGGKKILDDISVAIHKGQVKVVIGPSGAGKSTFLQCLNLLLRPNTGSVFLDGQEIDPSNKCQTRSLRQHVGMIFQDFNLFDHLTAKDNVAVALKKVKHMSAHDANLRAMMELERVGLAQRSTLYPAQLSGGQKQRVAIARALAMDPIVILLDEPTSALDPELVGEVTAVIRELARGGMTMVMASHQMEFAKALATEILFMEKGKIIEHGSPAELLAPGVNSRTQDFCNKLFSEEPAC